MARLYVLLIAVLAVLGVVVAASYNVTITVNDNGAPVSGATVEVYDINNTLVASGTTSVNGTVSLNLTDGQYILKVIFSNNTYTYNITVDANHTAFTFDIGGSNTTATTTATSNTTSITDRVREWWSSLSMYQKAVMLGAGMLALIIIGKRLI